MAEFPLESIVIVKSPIENEVSRLGIVQDGLSRKLVGLHETGSRIHFKDSFTPAEFNRMILEEKVSLSMLVEDQKFKEYMKTQEFESFIVANQEKLLKIQNINADFASALGKALTYEKLLSKRPDALKFLMNDSEFRKYAASGEFTQYFMSNYAKLVSANDMPFEQVSELIKKPPQTLFQRMTSFIPRIGS